MNSHTLSKLALTVLSALVLPDVLGGSALADTYIKGTQVSYNKEIYSAKKTNTSSVYIDEASDTANKNYVQFACEDGGAIFYLNNAQALYNKAEDDSDSTPDIKVVVDGGRPVTFSTVSTNSEGKVDFTTLAVSDKFDAQMLRLFQSAKNSVVISLVRFDKKQMNFTFYPKGLSEALKIIRACQ